MEVRQIIEGTLRLRKNLKTYSDEEIVDLMADVIKIAKYQKGEEATNARGSE